MWVRSSLRSPSGVRLQEEGVVHLPRRVRGGKFSADEVVEVVLDVRALRPRAKPISAKMAIISSITCMVGCTEPLRRGGAGRERSSRPAASWASSAASSSSALRAAIGGGDAVAQAVDRRALARGARRGSSAPRVFSSAEIDAGLAERGDAHLVQRLQVGGGGDLRGEVGFEFEWSVIDRSWTHEPHASSAIMSSRPRAECRDLLAGARADGRRAPAMTRRGGGRRVRDRGQSQRWTGQQKALRRFAGGLSRRTDLVRPARREPCRRWP